MARWTWLHLVAVSTALSFAGCGKTSEFKPASQLPATAEDHGHGHSHDHDHAAEGPHHGSLIELGNEEFHAELVVDEAKHLIKLYLLGPDAKTPATTTATEALLKISDTTTLKLVAVRAVDGKASEFELEDEKAVHEATEDGFIHGTLTLKVNDKDLTGEVDAHFDSDHQHDEPTTTPATTETPATTPEPAAEKAP